MYCVNCGSQHDVDSSYCQNCGLTFPQHNLALTSDQPQQIRLMQSLAGADLSHERVGSIVRQIIGLAALMIAVFAIAQKPSPGIFILYAIPPLLGGVVIVLERKASVGKAMFVLAMLIPYFSLFLVGVPPIFVSGVQDVSRAASGLAGFFSSVAFSVAFLVGGFLFMIFSSIVSLIVEKKPLIAGGAALLLTIAFTMAFMSLLGNPATAVAQSVTVSERPAAGVVIHTTALAPDANGKLNETPEFKSNELIYTYTGGLTAGTRFGYRVTSPSGAVVIPFDRSMAVVAKGTGLDKYEAFNTLDARLDPGSYSLELLVSEGWTTSIAARTTITVDAGTNPNYGTQTDDPYSWLALAAGVPVTQFKKDDGINLVLDGSRLDAGVSISIKGAGDKVVLEKTYTAMPLGKSQYVIADKASELGTGQFVAAITTQGKDPTVIYFTIQ